MKFFVLMKNGLFDVVEDILVGDRHKKAYMKRKMRLNVPSIVWLEVFYVSILHWFFYM